MRKVIDADTGEVVRAATPEDIAASLASDPYTGRWIDASGRDVHLEQPTKEVLEHYGPLREALFELAVMAIDEHIVARALAGEAPPDATDLEGLASALLAALDSHGRKG